METGTMMKNDAEAELDITCSSGVTDSPGLQTKNKKKADIRRYFQSC